MLRRTAIEFAAALCLPGAANMVQAQTHDRMLRIIIPFGAGGGTDNLTRLLSASLSKTLNRTVIIDNRPGASGLIASKLVQQAPTDGTMTVMVQNIGFVGLPYTQRAANFDPIKDFTPVAMIGDGPAYIYIHSSVPATTMAQFIAYAKTVPGGLESATSGPGGGSHMWTLLLSKRAGITLLPVPYKSGAEMSNALISGEAKVFISNATEALNAQVRAGRLRILGVTSERPSPLSPGVPAVAETLPGLLIEGWYGFIGPASMPAADVQALSAAVQIALAEPGVKEKYASLFIEAKFEDWQQFAQSVRKTDLFYRRLVEELGITPQ